MNVAIIGATGKSGHCLTQEAMQQGHTVTAIVRDAQKITDPTLRIVERDIFALTQDDIKNFDVVINAFKAPEGKEQDHVRSLIHLIGIFEALPKVRLLAVGGAGSLFVDAAQTVRVMDSKDFPPEYLPTASNMARAFDLLRASKANWTYLSPSAFYDPAGARTGHYSLGKDTLLLNKGGQSYVSYADFALAMIDEIRNKAHVRQRFTVVGEQQV